MPQRIRCRFELYSSDVCGLPADADAVKLLVEHHTVTKRYAATDTLPASQGSTVQIEELLRTAPLLTFTCHVYPSKAVNLRLMGRLPSTRARSSLLSRSTIWTQLATATLPLDQLAQQLLLPGIAAAPATHRASTELSAGPQMPAGTAAAQPQDVSHTPILARSISPFATPDLPAEEQVDVQGDEGTGHCTRHTGAAAAAAAGTAQSTGVAAAEKAAVLTSHHLDSQNDSEYFEGDEDHDAVRRATQGATELPLAAGDGLLAEAVYGAELQTSQLAVTWVPELEGLLLQQQLVVKARLLPSRGSGWAHGIFSAKKGSSIDSSSRRTSTSTSTSRGGGPPGSQGPDRLHRNPPPGAGEAEAGAAVPRSGASPIMRDDDKSIPSTPSAAAGGSSSAPTSPAHAAAQSGVQAAGRPPSFERWVDTASADSASDTSHLPAGHPLKFLANRVPTTGPQHSVPAAGRSNEQQQAEAACEGPDEEQAVKHEFLQLILATLSSAHSVESEAALPPPSAAQLAAAASLPRAPSAADLAAFAAAAGLPIEKVAEAAATKLGTGYASSNVAADDGSSAGANTTTTSRRNTQATTQDEPAEPVDTATAAATTTETAEPVDTAFAVLAAASPQQSPSVAVQTGHTSPGAEAQMPGNSAADPAAAISAAAFEAAKGEMVNVTVQPPDTAAAGSAAEALTVPALTIAAAAPVDIRDDTGVAQRALRLMKTAATGAAAGSCVEEPLAVVTATAVAVPDDSSRAAAAHQQIEAQGWGPQQLPVLITNITAVPVHIEPGEQPDGMAGKQPGITAATADKGLSSTDVMVTSSTDVAVTCVTDAELADFAAPVPVAPGKSAAAAASYFDSDGPGGLPGPVVAAPLYQVCRGDSLGLGAMGEGGATQLHAVGGAAAAAIKDFSRAAAAADASAATASSWAAEHEVAEPSIAPAAAGSSSAGAAALPAGRAPLTTVQEAADWSETTGHAGKLDLASKGLVMEASPLAPDLQAPNGALQSVGPSAAVTSLAALGGVGSLEPAVPNTTTGAGGSTAEADAGADTAALVCDGTADVGVSPVSRHFASAEHFSPAGPAVDVDQLEQEQQEDMQQQQQQPGELISEEALELQLVYPSEADAGATEAETEIQPANDRLDGTAAAAAADRPPDIDQVATSHQAASVGLVLHNGATGPQGSSMLPEQHNVQQQQQPSGFLLSAHPRLQQQGDAHLQPITSGTNRLAEVLERINSQYLARAARASSADARPAFHAVLQPYNSQEVASQAGGIGLSSSALLTTAGSVALAVPQLLLSTALTAVKVAGSRARSRATTHSSTVSAESGAETGAPSAAYWGITQAAAGAADLALFIPRGIALGMFSVWLLVVTQVFVRPWLALLSGVMPAISRRSASLTEQGAAVGIQDSSHHLQATAERDTESGAVVRDTSSIIAEQDADAGALRSMSGSSASGDDHRTWRTPDCVSRSASSASLLVPPTPAPSLEVGQSPCAVPERSWSGMMGLLIPALSRSLSISSVPATPPSTPLSTPAHSAAALPQLDLSPATLTAAAHTAGVGSSSSRPRRSRLGTSCTGGLSTIGSVTDLVAAAEAAEAAADHEAVATTTAAAAVPESFSPAADGGDVPRGTTWRWWNTRHSSAAADTQGNPSGDDSSHRGWWKAWTHNSAAVAEVSVPAPAVAWWPGWLLFTAPNSSARPGIAAVVADNGVPALMGIRPSVPVSVDGQSSSGSEEAAAFEAPQPQVSWLASVTDDWGNILQQLLQMMLTPVLWYVDAVTCVLRSGVHTAAWLVELAVWWALLPARFAWCSIMLPFRASAAVWGLFVHNSSRQVHNEEVRGPGAS